MEEPDRNALPDEFTPRRPPWPDLMDERDPRPRGDRSRWHWLLLVAVVVPLLTPLYDRTRPEFIGLPFFYWCQIAFVILAAVVTTVVYLATKRRVR